MSQPARTRNRKFAPTWCTPWLRHIQPNSGPTDKGPSLPLCDAQARLSYGELNSENSGNKGKKYTEQKKNSTKNIKFVHTLYPCWFDTVELLYVTSKPLKPFVCGKELWNRLRADCTYSALTHKEHRGHPHSVLTSSVCSIGIVLGAGEVVGGWSFLTCHF